MGVTTRSKAKETKIRPGRLDESFGGLNIKSPRAKKKSQVKSKTTTTRPSVALGASSSRPSLSRRDVKAWAIVRVTRSSSMSQLAENMASNIISQITKAKQIGGAFNANLLGFYNYLPTLTRYLEGCLRRRKDNPKLKIWIFLVREALVSTNDAYGKIYKRFASVDLPISVAIESEFMPIDYVACYDQKYGTREFFPFHQEVGLEWKMDKDFLILVSSRETNGDDYTLLPLKKPSMIDALQPDRVAREHEQVYLKYKDIDILARSTDISENIEDLIETEESLDLEMDFDPLDAAAKEDRRLLKERYEYSVQSEKNIFSGMIASLTAGNRVKESSVKASLEAMKVFNIYPEYESETLPPPTEVVWFGGTQRKGDVKNAKLDSVYGNVNGYY